MSFAELHVFIKTEALLKGLSHGCDHSHLPREHANDASYFYYQLRHPVNVRFLLLSLPAVRLIPSPLIRTSDRPVKCFHSTDEFKHGHFYPDQNQPLASNISHLPLGALKAWTQRGRFGVTFALKVLGKKTISLQTWSSVDMFKLSGHVLWVSGPGSCVLLPRHHTNDRAWRSHRRWSRGSIPVGRRAPVNGQDGSSAPLGGCRWPQSHRCVWAPLGIHPDRALPPRLLLRLRRQLRLQTGRSTREAVIWAECEVENIFRWIQFVVNLSQTVWFSNGALVHERQHLNWHRRHFQDGICESPTPPLAEADTFKPIR